MGLNRFLNPFLRGLNRLFRKTNLFLKIAGKIIALIDLLIPKDSHIIIFGSSAARRMTGCPKVLFENISNRYPRFRPYFFLRTPTSSAHIAPTSLRGLLVFLRAKYLVSSHGSGDFSFYSWSRRKVHIATWHGLPMKQSGLLRKNLTASQAKRLKEYVSSVDVFLASSKYEAGLICMLFGHPGSSARVIGHPRCDKLLDPSDPGRKKLISILGLEGDERIILYAPTFREKGSNWGDSAVELFPFKDFKQSDLFSFIENENAVILLRTHVNDKITTLLTGSERIKDFSFDVMPDIYEILSGVDILITDYSSLAYDYLLLRRPIIFIPYDIDDYRLQPGFIIDNYDFWTPGIKVNSLKELHDYLKLIFERRPDPFEDQRHELTGIVQASQSNDTTSKFLQLLREF